MEKCFAEISINECSALKVKVCHGCNFYKPASIQKKVVARDTLKEINIYKGIMPEQILKTLVGQVKSGDIGGARKGLERARRRVAL